MEPQLFSPGLQHGAGRPRMRCANFSVRNQFVQRSHSQHENGHAHDGRPERRVRHEVSQSAAGNRRNGCIVETHQQARYRSRGGLLGCAKQAGSNGRPAFWKMSRQKFTQRSQNWPVCRTKAARRNCLHIANGISTISMAGESRRRGCMRFSTRKFDVAPFHTFANTTPLYVQPQALPLDQVHTPVFRTAFIVVVAGDRRRGAHALRA